MKQPLFAPKEVENAWKSLPSEIRETPLVRARRPGLMFKLETLQPTGSYKIRAAFTRLSRDEGSRGGVALSSSGNFASAFTWACRRFDRPAHLVVTPQVNSKKMELARQNPCTVHVCGESYESRFQMLAQLEEKGIETIDHRTCRTVFLGHSTIGWECRQQATFERILIPLSTGGLAVGVAASLRQEGFEGEILGVQPAGNPTLYESWKAGHPVQRRGITTMCDALTATSIPDETFRALRLLLDDVLLVKEESVRRSVKYLALEEGIVAEPGAAVGVAALLEGQREWTGSLCLITGRNIEAQSLINCCQEEVIYE